MIIVAFFLIFSIGYAISEQIILTTYYPAPYGAYASFLITGDTFLARDAGNVGIGTVKPSTKLQINGSLGIGNL